MLIYILGAAGAVLVGAVVALLRWGDRWAKRVSLRGSADIIPLKKRRRRKKAHR